MIELNHEREQVNTDAMRFCTPYLANAQDGGEAWVITKINHGPGITYIFVDNVGNWSFSNSSQWVDGHFYIYKAKLMTNFVEKAK